MTVTVSIHLLCGSSIKKQSFFCLHSTWAPLWLGPHCIWGLDISGTSWQPVVLRLLLAVRETQVEGDVSLQAGGGVYRASVTSEKKRQSHSRSFKDIFFS